MTPPGRAPTLAAFNATPQDTIEPRFFARTEQETTPALEAGPKPPSPSLTAAAAGANAPPTLAEIGAALYGETYWQRPMARDLGRGLRTVHRWAAAGRVPDEAVMRRLLELLVARESRLIDLRARMGGEKLHMFRLRRL